MCDGWKCERPWNICQVTLCGWRVGMGKDPGQEDGCKQQVMSEQRHVPGQP